VFVLKAAKISQSFASERKKVVCFEKKNLCVSVLSRKEEKESKLFA
jgi:hypothetical protein